MSQPSVPPTPDSPRSFITMLLQSDKGRKALEVIEEAAGEHRAAAAIRGGHHLTDIRSVSVHLEKAQQAELAAEHFVASARGKTAVAARIMASELGLEESEATNYARGLTTAFVREPDLSELLHSPTPTAGPTLR